MRGLCAWYGALLVFSLVVASSGLADTGAGPADSRPLQAAFGELVETLRAVEADIRSSPSFGTDAEQVGGYRHILRALAKGVEVGVLQDADFPYFRIIDFWLREGGDNPDQRYAVSSIRGGASYRVWGTLGSAVRVELQIYAGRPWDGSGRSAGYLTFEDLQLEDDGSFEIWISPGQREGNWLENPADATTLLARHIYDQWTDEPTGEIHIDRVGFEGRRRPPETREALADRIRATTHSFATTARTWPGFVNRNYVAKGQANTVAPPRDTYALGGVKGRWISGGHFALEEGQALVLRMPRSRAHYQAVQLTDMWFASLEYGNQVSSLTSKQSVLAPDGAYYYVISPHDPGYANWLDSGALARGVFLLRWDGVQEELSQDQHPSGRLVSLEEIEAAIPGFEWVSEGEREAVRQDRRRHLQRRSHR